MTLIKKLPTKTVAKVSITHDRVSLTVKFLSGHVLKTAVNRYSDSFKVEAPVGAKSMPDCNGLFKFVCKAEKGELHGQRFERLAKFFEQHISLEQAIAAAK